MALPLRIGGFFRRIAQPAAPEPTRPTSRSSAPVTQRYPLAWPSGTGWPRTPASARKKAQFSTRRESGQQTELTLAVARDRLDEELTALKASDAVLSTNVELKASGAPINRDASPADCGAAVYFMLKGKPIALACDKWNTVADNIAALAKHIGALRGMDRWGVGSQEQVFTGYTALPAPMVLDDWRALLDDPTCLADAQATFHAKMLRAHPDRGGSHAQAAALNAAMDAARKAFAA